MINNDCDISRCVIFHLPTRSFLRGVCGMFSTCPLLASLPYRLTVDKNKDPPYQVSWGTRLRQWQCQRQRKNHLKIPKSTFWTCFMMKINQITTYSGRNEWIIVFFLVSFQIVLIKSKTQETPVISALPFILTEVLIYNNRH